MKTRQGSAGVSGGFRPHAGVRGSTPPCIGGIRPLDPTGTENEKRVRPHALPLAIILSLVIAAARGCEWHGGATGATAKWGSIGEAIGKHRAIPAIASRYLRQP